MPLSKAEFSAEQSLPTARLHRLNFYVVLRELIPKLQAFPESIQDVDGAILLVHLLGLQNAHQADELR